MADSNILVTPDQMRTAAQQLELGIHFFGHREHITRVIHRSERIPSVRGLKFLALHRVRESSGGEQREIFVG